MAVPAIIVQGGGYLTYAERHIYKELTVRAANEGYDVLMNGGTAVDAAEHAIRVFEGHDHINAGRGSCLNASGEVECDSMIMDGHGMRTGAVISARHFRHPVSIARKIMDESPHCALSGEGALEFALSLGNFNEICAPNDLKGDDCPNQIRLNISQPEYGGQAHLVYVGQATDTQDSDTVSAVAMDVNGYLACANSTGGKAGKLKGRVSDAGLVGCGGYANTHGAAATNGCGESLMKMTLAREAVYHMEQERNAQEAAENAIQRLKNSGLDHPFGGVIAIDKNGNFGKAFNTTKAVWASKKDNRLDFRIRINELEFEEL